jgi:hypothetical protein
MKLLIHDVSKYDFDEIFRVIDQNCEMLYIHEVGPHFCVEGYHIDRHLRAMRVTSREIRERKKRSGGMGQGMEMQRGWQKTTVAIRGEVAQKG